MILAADSFVARPARCHLRHVDENDLFFAVELLVFRQSCAQLGNFTIALFKIRHHESLAQITSEVAAPVDDTCCRMTKVATKTLAFKVDLDQYQVFVIRILQDAFLVAIYPDSQFVVAEPDTDSAMKAEVAV
jgi:hypothetical protein